MRIGHTLFGGAVAGLVIASGVALCMSSANANYEVIRHYESSTEATATGSGYAIKYLYKTPQTIMCTATAQGSCVVEYKPLPVEITGTATANGIAKAEYFTYAFGNSYALTSAKPVRIVKLYPHHANATCYAQGEGQSWQLGHAKTALAKAIGFGTTYYVGNGNVVAKATITSQPSLKIGVYSNSVATAEAVVTGKFTIGAAGLATAVADVLVDSAVTVEGVRIFTANGISKCEANIIAQTIGVHQAQTGRCYANIVASPKVQVGSKGKGFAYANGLGDSVGMATGAATVEGETSAIAIGKPKYNANAYSQCMATAISTGNGKRIETRVITKIGKAIAVSTGYGFKIKYVGGDAYSKCLTTAAASKTITGRAVDILAVSTGVINTTVLSVTPYPAKAVVTLKDKVKRIVSASTSTVAEATAMGYLQVNDMQEAPEIRTYRLEHSVRLTIVSEEPRTVVV